MSAPLLPLHIKPSLNPFDRLLDIYRRAIEQLVASHAHSPAGMIVNVIGGVLLEPLSTLRTLLNKVFTWRQTFHSEKLNPLTLNIEQSAKPPILLIHGNLLDQSSWLPLTDRLNKEKLGPIFTVNLPSGHITNKDIQLLENKIAHIQGVYRLSGFTPRPIDIIGHSRGGELAKRIALSGSPIRKVIKLGSVLTQSEAQSLKQDHPHFQSHVFELLGKYDIFTPKTSYIQHQTIDTGHMGLLYSRKAHDQMIKWLKQRF